VGAFFPGLDPSVNLIVWLWVWTKSQFYNCYQDNSPGCVTNLLNSLQWESLLQRRWKQTLVMTDRIRNKIRNGNWFPKFSINRKEQKFLLICLRLLTLLTIIKDPSLRGLRGNQDRQKLRCQCCMFSFCINFRQSILVLISVIFPLWVSVQIETKFGAGLSCHFAVDKFQSLCQFFPQNH
jgi:hypothetical protein